MPFVPNVDCDVLVTFADADNVSLTRDGEAWVSKLVRQLGVLLRQHAIAAPEIRTALAGHVPATASRADAVQTSATLIVVMSPAYLGSPWLAEPATRDHLLTFARRSPASTFVVSKMQVGDGEEPSELRACHHIVLWERDDEVPRTLGVTSLGTDNRAYYARVDDLAWALAARLKALAKPPPPSGDRSAVYLAEATAELDEQREAVKRRLEQAGLTVMPRGRLPTAAGDFDRAVAQALVGCRVFVQLLGAVAGERPLRQLELAQSVAADLPVLQWRDPGLDVTTVADGVQRALLGGAAVRAESIADFCRAVQEMAAPAAPALPAGDGPFVFVDARREDIPEVERIFERHRAIRWDWHEPSRANLRTLLRNVRAVIVFWGSCDSAATIERYYLLRGQWKALKRRPDRLRIYDGPPEHKPGFPGRGFPIIHGRHSDEPEALTTFLKDVQSETA